MQGVKKKMAKGLRNFPTHSSRGKKMPNQHIGLGKSIFS